MEEMILRAVHQLNGTPGLDALMLAASRLGDLGLVWIIIALFLLLRRRTRCGGLVCVCALLLSLLFTNVLLKNLLMRPRPYEVFTWLTPLVPPLSDWSFPSGHASASFAAITALWPFSRRWRWAALALAALISFSRLYVGVHYPTDVLGGIIVGICCGLLARIIVGYAWRKKT